MTSPLFTAQQQTLPASQWHQLAADARTQAALYARHAAALRARIDLDAGHPLLVARWEEAADQLDTVAASWAWAAKQFSDKAAEQ